MMDTVLRASPSATILLFVMELFGDLPLVLALLKDVVPARSSASSRELGFALGVVRLFRVVSQATGEPFVVRSAIALIGAARGHRRLGMCQMTRHCN